MLTGLSTSLSNCVKTPKDSARVMALVIHPYIMGAPHRLKYFRKAIEHIRNSGDALLWTGEQIVDWYRAAGRMAK